MDDNKKPLKEEVTDTMACSAFAEAGEPCPIDPEVQGTNPASGQDEKKSAGKEVEDTMACAAFAESGEPCPIDPEVQGTNPASEQEEKKSDPVH